LFYGLFAGANLLAGLYDGFYESFIAQERYLLILNGLGNTLLLSLLAALFGILIGVFMTYCRLSRFSVLRAVSGVYIDVIRGTPSFIQLLIIYFVVFGQLDVNKLLVAGLAFGINSGAYVSEIIRAGIQSIDFGQTEAGRSLGLTQKQTMQYIIFPQAIKNILPALANEFIVLIKETAVCGYIAVSDITNAARMIYSSTYDASWPLLGAAVIYYVIIKLLTMLFRKLEERLRRADAR